MIDLYEFKVVIFVVKENFDLLVFCIMIFEENMRIFIGCLFEVMVFVFEGLGVDVFGVNCLFGLK